MKFIENNKSLLFITNLNLKLPLQQFIIILKNQPILKKIKSLHNKQINCLTNTTQPANNLS